MKTRGIVVRALGVLVVFLAGCTGQDSDVSPDPSPPSGTTPAGPERYDPLLGFTPLAAYDMVATIGTKGNKQHIILTVGRPEDGATYSKRAKQPLACTGAKTVIPWRLVIVNESPTASPATDIGVALTPALATGHGNQGGLKLGYQTELGPDCFIQVATWDTSSRGLTQTSPTQMWISSSRPTKSGSQLVVSGLYALGEIAEPAIPASALFVRLSPLPDKKPLVSYTITSVTPTGGITGMITDGSAKGAVFVPLDSTNDPCAAFADTLAMWCVHERPVATPR